MKVLIFAPVADNGGVSQYILSLLKSVSITNTKFVFASFVGGSLIDQLSSLQIPSIILSSSVKNKGIFSAISKLRNLVRKEKVNVVHAHTARAGLIASIALFGLPTKLIYTGHGWRFEQVSGISRIIQMLAAIIICWRAKTIVALSQHEFDSAIRHYICSKNKMRIIRTNISITGYDDINDNSLKDNLLIPKGAFVVGFVASAVKEKDPNFFIETCAIIAHQSPNTHFLWVGGGPLEEDMLRKIKALGLKEKFTVTGTVEHTEIPRYLSIMDTFFMSSSIEVFPISLLEAMAAKRVCVVPDVGAVSEIVYHNVTGFLYIERNSDSVATIILNSKDSLLGINAQKYVKENLGDTREVASEYMKLYQTIL